MSSSTPSLKTYFWVIHYGAAPAALEGALVPVPTGKSKFIAIVPRDVYGSQAVGFAMLREGDGHADPRHFRGEAGLRNRVVGFYASIEEANARLHEDAWRRMRDKGALYAELHCVTVAEAKPEAANQQAAA